MAGLGTTDASKYRPANTLDAYPEPRGCTYKFFHLPLLRDFNQIPGTHSLIHLREQPSIRAYASKPVLLVRVRQTVFD